MYQKLVTVVRYLFGVQMTLSGLNWWVKLTLYPSIVDYIDKPPDSSIAGALIATGFMFHVVKAIELLCGLAMLANLYVPLALVASFSVTACVFMTDVFINTKLRGLVMGTVVMVESVFLMFAYLSYYKPMLTAKTQPDPL